MAYSMNQLIADCRDALKNGESLSALQTVRGHAEKALRDPDFVTTILSHRSAPPEREVLYEDPDYGFCICAHIYDGAKIGFPHDHGPTWAIYGQAEGTTEMTDWAVTAPASGDQPAKVSETRRYTLKPGDVHLYPAGDIHAPIRVAPTKLLRIEGRNTDRIERTPLEKA